MLSLLAIPLFLFPQDPVAPPNSPSTMAPAVEPLQPLQDQLPKQQNRASTNLRVPPERWLPITTLLSLTIAAPQDSSSLDALLQSEDADILRNVVGHLLRDNMSQAGGFDAQTMASVGKRAETPFDEPTEMPV